MAAALFLAGCASLSPDGGVADVAKLTLGKTAGVDVALNPGPTVQAEQALGVHPDHFAAHLRIDRVW